MHDARRFNALTTRNRLVISGLLAIALAMGFGVARPMASSICAAYTPSDVEWYLFFCYLEDPPKDPRT